MKTILFSKNEDFFGSFKTPNDIDGKSLLKSYFSDEFPCSRHIHMFCNFHIIWYLKYGAIARLQKASTTYTVYNLIIRAPEFMGLKGHCRGLLSVILVSNHKINTFACFLRALTWRILWPFRLDSDSNFSCCTSYKTTPDIYSKFKKLKQSGRWFYIGSGQLCLSFHFFVVCSRFYTFTMLSRLSVVGTIAFYLLSDIFFDLFKDRL